ncbi:DUF7344 domain-containing protein [Salinigranum salinum]|uniref:DUF7344 domain-containing protein n=1 Tax=Salinigranum salinum TaxID=1364937 RepID=UPI001F04642A|nr:hypothetical protein [Salinigranum salinum]
MTSEIITGLLSGDDGDESDTVRTSTSTVSNGIESDETDSDRSTDAALTKDTLFELLKNQRRRDALAFLKATGGRTTLSDMAEHIAAKENDVPVEAINSKQRKRVYIGLYQCHLPKMADAGIVDFEKNRGTIELCALATQLDPYLDAPERGTTDAGTESDGVDEHATDAENTTLEGSRSQAALLAGLGVLALAGVAGVPGPAFLSVSTWAVACAVALVASAVVPFVRD